MTIMRGMTEMWPGVRWRVGPVVTRSVYRRSFGSVRGGTVIARPSELPGVETIRIENRCPPARMPARPVGG